MMYGYACDETANYLPLSMVILQILSRKYDKLRKKDKRFLSDGKAQITGYYDDDNHLYRIKTFTISYQNTEIDRISTDKIIKDLVLSICDSFEIEVEEFLINPTGRFNIGGFDGDAGVTGRKVLVDNYQAFSMVGGGAFSGKDPTKVDRSGAYKARQIAIFYLKKYHLKWCQVQLSYAIGKRRPLAILIDSNIGVINPNEKLFKECEPHNIIKDLDLLNIVYYDKAKFGHFTNKDF